MRTVPVLLVVLLLVLRAIAGNDSPALYWAEDFGRFDVGPAGGFGEECEIREAGGQKYLHGTQWMLGGMDYFGAKHWNNYTFRFRFRFTDPGKIGFYPLVKSGGRRGDVGYMWYYVNFRRDAITFTCHGLAKELADQAKYPAFKYEAAGLGPLEAGRWYTTDIRVTHTRIDIRLSSEDGRMKEVVSIETLPGDGGVNILSYSPVDIADITVEKLSK